VHIGEEIVVVSVAADMPLRPDDRVWIAFDQDRLHLFDRRTEQALSAA
jgi:multiple sugar transport system ATP-binding protein